MRTKISRYGKLSSVILSVIMMLNSIGITALAAAGSNGDSHSWSNETGKTGEFADHVHLQMAAGDYQASVSSLDFKDELTWEGGKMLYLKVVDTDAGYTLNTSDIIAKFTMHRRMSTA